MNAEGRYAALSTAESGDVELLADRILADGPSIRMIAGPQVVTAPVRYPVAGPGRSTSVLGHVALTTCAVALDGTRGDGVRRGRDLGGAVAAAICDAEAERGGPFALEVVALCKAARAAVARAGRARAALVGATRIGVSAEDS